MTIEFRPPRLGEEPQLQALFTEAFGDSWFTELFFQRGYSPDRCFLAAEEQVLAALPWFDCSLRGKRCAYVYGIATFEHCRGRGIGSALIRAAMAHLRQSYEAILLVPAEEGLFGYYERFGFSIASTICQETVLSGAPLPLRKLSISQYAALRREHLPPNGVIQEGAALEKKFGEKLDNIESLLHSILERTGVIRRQRVALAVCPLVHIEGVNVTAGHIPLLQEVDNPLIHTHRPYGKDKRNLFLSIFCELDLHGNLMPHIRFKLTKTFALYGREAFIPMRLTFGYFFRRVDTRVNFVKIPTCGIKALKHRAFYC